MIPLAAGTAVTATDPENKMAPVRATDDSSAHAIDSSPTTMPLGAALTTTPSSSTASPPTVSVRLPITTTADGAIETLGLLPTPIVIGPVGALDAGS